VIEMSVREQQHIELGRIDAEHDQGFRLHRASQWLPIAAAGIHLGVMLSVSQIQTVTSIKTRRCSMTTG
jgi:hypothetical protein